MAQFQIIGNVVVPGEVEFTLVELVDMVFTPAAFILMMRSSQCLLRTRVTGISPMMGQKGLPSRVI